MGLLDHVVLPRVLSETDPSKGLDLLSHMVRTIENASPILPTATVELFKRLKRVHMTRTPENISMEINNLKPGDTFATYMHALNTAFIIYVPKGSDEEIKNVTIATFPGNLEKSDIYSHSSDIQFTYPEQALKVKFSKMMRSHEFAHQLCIGYCEITGERSYATRWLTTILTDKDTSVTKFETITKKIREEAIDFSNGGSFQRSGFYMAIKVFLELSLSQELGAHGHFIYKIVMLQFITKFCEQYDNPFSYPKLDIDLMTQLLAKMARRIEKLPQITPESIPSKMSHFGEKVIASAKEIISKIRVRIDKQITKLQMAIVKDVELKPLVGLDFISDIYQQVPKLRAHLEKRKSSDGNHNIYNSALEFKTYMRHQMHQKTEPSLDSLKSNNGEIDCHLYLTDFENWMLYKLELNENSFDCKTLLNWFKAYASVAEGFHAGDPFSMSKMMLIRLKLVSMIDRLASEKHPLLLEHRSGIDPAVFDVLLLPQSIDMQFAFELQNYFTQRNTKASYPGLIEEDTISSVSFSARFGKQNAQMQAIRRELIEMGEAKIEEKRLEWKEGREKVRQLREKARYLHHCYWTYINSDDEEVTVHSSQCKLCVLNRQISDVKLTQYERPLPSSEYEQNAVVFELKLPVEIAVLRNILNISTKYGRNSASSVQIIGNWISNSQISHKKCAEHCDVSLGSSTSKSLYSIHVDKDFSTFVVENGWNCVFHSNHSSIFPNIATQTIKTQCTLNLGSNTPYSEMQWTINTTTHSQNTLLAQQSECPKNLSLSEFKAFGSLRADGHRLQIRKLYAMIETESLSFDQSSVLVLIQQSMWETGIIGESGFVRESHDDFINYNFTMAMIELLDKYIEQQKDNWAHPIKLLIITFITVRIYELNADEKIADQLIELLNKLRAISVGWFGKIQQALQKLETRTQSAEEPLRLLLINVSIMGAMTFFVNSKHKYFIKIFETNPFNDFTAPRTWLLSIITLNNNNLLNSLIKTQSESSLKMLIRMMRCTGIHIESKIRQIIQNDPSDIFNLIKQQWPLATKGEFTKFYFDEECPQVLVAYHKISQQTRHVIIDLITGTFLVNNLPVGLLPDNITSNQLFQRVFNGCIFEVQPDASNSFTSVHKYNECNYEFGWADSNKLIITEHRNDGSEVELIPIDVFTNDISELLVENSSHWWHKQQNLIEFRPRSFQSESFSKESGIEYRLSLNRSQLIQMKTGRCMLDIKSGSYRNILEYLTRLEIERYIHVLMDEPNIAKVELIRMNLKFKVSDLSQNNDGSFDMLSNELSGMKISLQQNCGTLYGLNHGLLLESVNIESSSAKLLLLPHSQVTSTCTDLHTSVNINLHSTLHNPPFHRYQVDDFLRQLKSNNSSFSAWFYLAYLHAITSHGENEPLTGVSGTERALQILQSSFVWSSAPYDDEAIKTLQLIQNLTPNRQLKGNVQKITWPCGIPKYCAQDSFMFIVKKLIGGSHWLNGSSQYLNTRDYLRCLQLKPNLRVSDVFIEHGNQTTNSLNISPISYSVNTRLVSSLYHAHTYKVPIDLNLELYLTSGHSLDGTMHMDRVQYILNHCVHIDFIDMWIPLYEAARRNELNSEQFGLIWSLYAHKGNNIKLILALQTVNNNAYSFTSIDPPAIKNYITSEGIYKSQVVSDILRSSTSKHVDYYSEEWSKADRRKHVKKVDLKINAITNFVTPFWPCDEVNLNSCLVSSKYISKKKANVLINEKLKVWNNNRKLYEFLDKIEKQIQTLQPGIAISPSSLNFQPPYARENWPKHEINFLTKMCQNIQKFEKECDEASELWFKEGKSERPTAFWWSLYGWIVNSKKEKHLIDAGMYPKTVPSLVLPQITSRRMHEKLRAIIGAIALAIVREQRSHRIKNYESDPQLKPALDRELENVPHINWNPSEYPEWLLFEIEQNLTIRRIQVEIAKRMIDPPDIGTKHSVMQLNMGEGKTAVIVPILAAVLANGDQACQITVLKSLFATNLNSLRQYLGGMLNRRMYTFPCRRNMPIAQYVPQMISIYEKCKRERGVILTLPEYRLSFQLKIYESVKKGDIDSARHFLNVHKWINANVRSILDESDAILNAKYQLIYTIGNQLSLDGGVNRWSVAQALLKRVPHHMKNLHAELGEGKIEFDNEYVQNGHVYGAPKVDYRGDVFTPCRILDESIYSRIKDLLVEDFLEGRLNIAFPEMIPSKKEDLKLFLSEKQINVNSLGGVMENFTIVQRDIVFILSGLLRFEVLKLVLIRRWRVNYGVNEKGTRKMAIPFKAKDVAAEMTEFGHPDVAICLTQLSYYYSGLTDDQLMRVFQILKANQNAAEIYEKWINAIPSELVEASVQSYTGVNLNDPTQRDGLLFPLLRFNMQSIDFWLSTDVFPREAKAFENKLICTAWDLCSDHMQHRVTGFSGTNDTKNILPLPIAQNDLEELEQTNENVRKTLLRPENQAYRKLPPNVSGKEILKRLVDNDISILLDAGALMLELNNKQMATEWLKIAPSEFDATVYFDSNDVLHTIDRNGLVAAFDCSVYRDNLSRCLVYLDDVHTRGTDLKFPLGWKACVTLSGDIARDKTVQACMRMRQLGKGHSIAFWASHEADIRIRETCNLLAEDLITNEHVIEFICSNSGRFEIENTVHWAAAGHNYTKKMAGHKLHENSSDKNAMTNLYETCVDNEFVTLENMYGDMEEAPLTEILNEKIDKLLERFKSNDDILGFINDVRHSVHEKFTKQAPEVKRFKHALDEEQEKELELELEEEREVERPPQMSPATPVFNELLRTLLSTGSSYQLTELKSTGGLISLSSSLSNTQLFHSYAQETNPWSENLFITRDFVRVLKTTSQSCDEFLRPVWWIGGVVINGKPIWILLSSYECDRLISTFRSSTRATLFMYRPRISKLHNSLIHEPRLRISGMAVPFIMDLGTEAGIGVYAGSMYFKTEAEQNAYCSFLGLIPRPRTIELEAEFDNGLIKPNGFVPNGDRQRSESMKKCVGDCRFIKNPVDLVMKLINAHHEFMRQESHVAHIVERGVKMSIQSDENSPSDGSVSRMDVDDDQQTNNREKAIKRSSESLMEPEPSTSKQTKFN